MNIQKLDEVLNAIAHFLQDEQIDFQGFNYDYWRNVFINFAKENEIDIGINEIKSRNDLLSVREIFVDRRIKEVSETPPPEHPEQTIPEKEILKDEPKQKRTEREGSKLKKNIYKESIESAERKARERAKAARAVETDTATTSTLPEGVPEVIYVTPKEEPKTYELTKEESQALLDDVNAAVEDPGRFAATLTEESLKQPETWKFLEGVEPETAAEVVHAKALEHTGNLRALDKSLPIDPPQRVLALTGVTSKNTPVVIVNSLTNPNDPKLAKIFTDSNTRNKVAEAAQNVALGSASSNDLAQAFFSKIGYPIEIFNPSTITDANISLTPSENSIEINTSNLIQVGSTLGNTYKDREEESGIDVGLDDIKKLKKLSEYFKRDWNSTVSNFESRGWRGIKSFFGDIKYSLTGQVPVTATTVVPVTAFGLTTTTALYTSWHTTSTPILGYSKTIATQIPQFSEAAVVGLTPQYTTTSTAMMFDISSSFTVVDSGGLILGEIGTAEVTGAAITATTEAAAEAVAIGTVEVVTGATGAAAGTGTGAIATITGALGSLATPVIGLIVAALSYIAVKILPWIKKHWKELVLSVLAIAAILISPVFIIPAIFLVAGMFVTGSAAVTGVTGVLGTMFVGFNTLVVSSILVPLLIILFVVPIIIALIVFIINSGAYVVPPDSLFGVYGAPTADVTSPWIGVEKTATPKGPFDNSNLNGPLEINYNIKVKAKKAALTNIVFENECRIRKEDASPTCTHPIPETDDNEDTETPITISPGEDYTFFYTSVYDNHEMFDDSYVTDTFKVTADVPDQSGAFASSSVSIKIGDPPSDCPYGWPINIPIVILQGPGGAYSHIGLEALDFRTPRGTPIYSTHSGTIIAVRSGIQAGFGSDYGNYVQVQSTCDTGSGNVTFSSLYAHFLSIKPDITVGASINYGDQIGTANDTGFSSEDHLHYEFRGLKMGPPYVDRIR